MKGFGYFALVIVLIFFGIKVRSYHMSSKTKEAATVVTKKVATDEDQTSPSTPSTEEKTEEEEEKKTEEQKPLFFKNLPEFAGWTSTLSEDGTIAEYTPIGDDHDNREMIPTRTSEGKPIQANFTPPVIYEGQMANGSLLKIKCEEDESGVKKYFFEFTGEDVKSIGVLNTLLTVRVKGKDGRVWTPVSISDYQAVALLMKKVKVISGKPADAKNWCFRIPTVVKKLW
jgi:hypothetical protein